MGRRRTIASGLVALSLVVGGIVLAVGGSSGAATLSPISVQGSRLVDGNGTTLQLRGVNRSGGEYACAGYPGWGFWDGPADQASVTAIKSWGVNAVRLPLNEACWLGIDGTAGTYGGQNYINAVTTFVNLLNANGIYVILDYQWGACGSTQIAQTNCLANWQKSMPDRPNATTFWASVATTFRSNHSVLFDAFNEPNGGGTGWDCWLNGGCIQYAGNAANQYVAEGMQPIVTAIRNAGATQPIMLGGLSYANDESGWLSHLPVDPDNALVLSLHLYDFNSPCNNTACLSSGTYSIAPAAASHPVVIGEFGEGGNGVGTFDTGVMAWADTNGYSYLAWTWDTWGCSGAVIISNYNGTPCSPSGVAIRNHYLAVAGAPIPTTTTSTSTTSTSTVEPSTTTLPTTTTTVDPNETFTLEQTLVCSIATHLCRIAP